MLVWRLFKKKPKFYHKHLFEHFHIWRSFLILLTEEVLSYHLSSGSSIISHKKVLSYHSTVRVHKSCCSFFFTCTAQNKVVAMLVFVLVVQYCLLACIIWPAAFTQILGAIYKCRFVFLFQLLNHICANSVTKEEVGVQRLWSCLHYCCVYTWKKINDVHTSFHEVIV